MFSEKLIFITGKGGVGKTTLVFALAHWYSEQKKKVLVVSPFFSPSTLETNWNFELHTLNAEICFKEYALLWLKSEWVFKLAFENPILKVFLNAVPGVKETLYAGKIWHLAQKPEWDHVLVDLPSFGHAYQFFNSLVGLRSVFNFGFVEKEISKVVSYFSSQHSRIDIVTTAEEIPVSETLEFYNQFKKNIPFPLGYIWINRVLPYFNLETQDWDKDSKITYNHYQSWLALREQCKKEIYNVVPKTIELPHDTDTDFKKQVLKLSKSISSIKFKN